MARDDAPERTTHADKVYALLFGQLMNGTFDPGAALNIPTLSREFEVSQTPIREALARLEGRLDADEQCGADGEGDDADDDRRDEQLHQREAGRVAAGRHAPSRFTTARVSTLRPSGLLTVKVICCNRRSRPRAGVS